MPDSFKYDDEEDHQDSSDFLIDDEDLRDLKSQKTELKGFQTAFDNMKIDLYKAPFKYINKDGQFTKEYWSLSQKISNFCDSF